MTNKNHKNLLEREQLWKKRDQGIVIELRRKKGSDAWMTARISGAHARSAKACHTIRAHDILKFYEPLSTI